MAFQKGCCHKDKTPTADLRMRKPGWVRVSMACDAAQDNGSKRAPALDLKKAFSIFTKAAYGRPVELEHA